MPGSRSRLTLWVGTSSAQASPSCLQPRGHLMAQRRSSAEQWHLGRPCSMLDMDDDQRAFNHEVIPTHTLSGITTLNSAS